jgi:hypothetical protein
VGAAQVLGFIFFGLTGGLLRRTLLSDYSLRRAAWILVIVGAALTLWYDLLTNLVFAAILGPFWPVLIGGLGFGIIHFISNAIIFGFSSLVINRIWKRIEYILPSLAG